ncbi:TonB-dependent receptor [Novosphingobium sp. KACC 22771]|uniref:TonB-dependent receptor n=1 Tax=Novosphingobium sp. KACC 22771 TaxID=3025670 RepID=UPI00236623C3|nr:TonB-dependent receptor [Novosphingobium sp. KACC 22771]WDF71375.1 TonB-dependent receptor [Novosphingobium sp. KACC 22771]
MSVKVLHKLLLASVGMAAAPQAYAQAPAQAQAPAAAAEAPGLQDIVVTAQRRVESVQKAAVAITAVSGSELIRAGVSDTTSLQRLAPALSVQPSGGTTSIYVRGVGTQAGNSYAENAVGFNFNGVFIARPTAPSGVYYDLQRVEVVKGPQGTLYGRNATGGAINVLPNRPKLNELSGDINLEAGNYDARKGSAAINLPLGSSVALRVAGQVVDRKGYLSDGYDDDKGEAARVSLLVKPSADWSVTLVGDYYHQHGMGAGNVLLPSSVAGAPALTARIGGSDPISVAALQSYASTVAAPPFCGGLGKLITSGCVMTPRGDGYMDGNFWGISAQTEGDLGFATLTVIPAYRRSASNYRSYLPGFQLQVSDASNQLSLETRLASKENGRLRYVLGGFYFAEDQKAINAFSQGNLSTTLFNPRLHTESVAGFGQLTFLVTPRLRLVAGGRYTHETKSQTTSLAAGGLPGVVNPPLGAAFTGNLAFNKATWKAGVEFDAGPRSLLYANVSTGFKAGGFFVAAPPANTFAPELLTAYTVGSKNRFWGNRLQFNIEAFYWDYTNQQISFVGGVPSSSGLYTQGGVTVNAGTSRIYGSEVELRLAPTRHDLLSANVQYLNGRYNSLQTANFSNTGAPLPTGCTVTGSRLANPGVNAARFYDTDCSGKPTVYSPRWTVNLDYAHTIELGSGMKLVAGARTTIKSDFYLNVNFQENEKQSAYRMSDAYLTLEGPDQRWSLSGFINNIENRAVLVRAGNRPILNVSYGTLAAPRVYGVRMGYHF